MAFTDELDSLLNTTKFTQEFLIKLQKSYSRAIVIRGELVSKLVTSGKAQGFNDQALNTTVFDAALGAAKEIATTILIEQIKKAAERTVEYREPILLSPLLQAADSLNNFFFTEHRSGLASTVKVRVDMNSTAGDLEQWANAVNAVRTSIIQSKNQDNPQKASDYWREHIYNTNQQGRYDITIADRFGLAGNPAPYWSLLNDGNKNAGMSSDWGGTAYPTNGPTRFTDKTEREVEDTFRRAFLDIAKPEQGQVAEDPEVRAMVDKLDLYIERMQQLIDSMESVDFKQDRINQLERYYQDQDRAIDKEKLRAAALEALANPNKQRFELTLSGTQRTRIRRKKLLQYLGETV